MSLLQLKSLAGVALSAASDIGIAGNVNTFAVKARIDGGLIASIGDFRTITLLSIDDGNATFGAAAKKFEISIQEGNGTGVNSITLALTSNGSGLQSLGGLSRATFTAGVPVVIYAQYSNVATPSGNWSNITIFTDAGAVVAGPATIPYSNRALNNAGLGRVRFWGDTSGFSANRLVDGLAIYSAELAGAAKYSMPTSADANLLGMWMMDETTGAVVGNGKAGGVSLALAGVEGTDYAWPAGGTWYYTVSPVQPPVAGFTATMNQKVVTVASTATQGTNPITSTIYDWGDGTAADAGPTHAYALPDKYTITQTVSDGTNPASTTQIVKTRTRYTYRVATSPSAYSEVVVDGYDA